MVTLLFYQQGGIVTTEITNPFTKMPTNPSQDAYTPDYADQTTPIEDFEPDFSRPIKVKITEESKGTEFVVDGKKMTPIATDDLQEEEDEDKR